MNITGGLVRVAQMRIDSEVIKVAVHDLKVMQNEGQNRDYYTGYMSALSTVEGIIASMEHRTDHKCRECRYLSDTRHSRSWFYCDNPNKEYKGEYSHLKNKWQRSCRFFEHKSQTPE